eukprot:g3754.t1
MPTKIHKLTMSLSKKQIEEDLMVIRGIKPKTKNKAMGSENAIPQTNQKINLKSFNGRQKKNSSHDERESSKNKKNEFEVERVMKTRKSKDGHWLLYVRWANCSPSEDSWIPESYLHDPIYTYTFAESAFDNEM